MGSRFYSPAHGNFLNRDTTPAGNPYAYAGDNPVTVTDLTGHSPDRDSSGTGQITQAEVDQAKARAADARAKADRAKTAATQARNTEARDLAALNAAADYARQMNTKAGQAYQAYTEAWQQAENAWWIEQNDLYAYGFSSVAALQAKVAGLQNALEATYQQLYRDENPYQLQNCDYPINGPPVCQSGPPSQANPYQEERILFDQATIGSLNGALNLYRPELTQAQNDAAAVQKARSKANSLLKAYQDAANAASRADQALSLARTAYNQAVATANILTQEAAQAQQAANNAESEYQKLKQEYDKQQKEKTKPKKHPGSKPGGFLEMDDAAFGSLAAEMNLCVPWWTD